MRLLISNAAVLTMDSRRTFLDDGYVAIEDGRIVYVGAVQPEGFEAQRVIGGRGLLAMPGLVNTHTHAAMTLLRGYANDLPLREWLFDKVFPVEERMTQETVYAGTVLAIEEMLKTGTTCFLDMYMHMDGAARAVRDSGIRAVLTRGMSGSALDGAACERIAENEDFIARWQHAQGGRIRAMMGIHAEYTCSPEFMRACLESARHCNVGIHIHMSETQREVEECLERHGMTPAALFAQLGMMDIPMIAAHCVAVTDEDMQLMAQHNVAVSHNPGSNLKLASGFAPVPWMRQMGITVGLGTDGAASNNNLDVWEEMRLAALIHKGYLQDPVVIPAYDALAMATIEGAKAIGLDKQIGSLEPGKRADLILVDIEQPQYYPRIDLVNHLVYAGSSGDVRMTMVDGVVLMENGTVLGMNCEENHRTVAQIAQAWYS